MTTPTVNSEPSVEEALRELREMLPEYEGHEDIRIEICISVGYLKWVGSSLSEAMEQARLWNAVHARRFFCSCGGALTAEELAEHVKRGHN